MNTVIIQDEEIRLSSGLNEYSFGKTNYYAYMSENGLVFENNKFEKWIFTDVRTFNNNAEKEKSNEDPESQNIVFYCGKNPLSDKAKSLLDFFQAGGDELFKAVEITVKAMTYAAKNNVILPSVGAGGIIIDLEMEKVLFLPEDIFKYSTNLLSREQYFIENTAWTNVTISGIPAICHERALIVYKLLTNRFPYPSKDEEERNADILDKNFLPLELCIEGINQEFASEINKALRLSSITVSQAKENKKEKDNSDLIVHTDFNMDQLKEAWDLSKNMNISENELNEKTASYIKTQKLKIETKRKIRRNTTAIISIAGALIFIVIMAFASSHRQNMQLTSKGLTSTEVIQGFFQGVNTKQTNQMSILAKGPAPDQFIKNINEVYLFEKQIASFTKGATVYANPETWLLNITNDEKFGQIRVFGVSNLKIDGIPEELNVEIYRRNQKPTAVTSENGKEILDKDEITHNVEYYLIQTNPEDYSIFVQKVTEKYTLTYRNSKWVITDIVSQQENIPVNTEQFRKDYEKAANNNDNILGFLNELKAIYPWLPSDYAVEQEYMHMIYESTH